MPSGSSFIQGSWIEGKGESFASANPATGETVWSGASATKEQVELAVSAARETFDSWADTRLEDRFRYLEAFRDQLEGNRKELAQTISRETGKPRWESLTEAASMIGKVAVSIEAYRDRCREVTGESAGASTVVRFRPHGAVAVLGPFNFPGHLPNGHIVPALLAGNTVVFKPSSQAPLTGHRMTELWEAAGLPAGVLNLVQGTRTAGNALVNHPDLDGLFFTGSSAGGNAIHQAFAGDPGKILALEMGGNNPLIVWEASDPEAAAYLTVLSAYITAGQRCSCARRLIVPRGKEGEDFLEHLVAMIGKIRVGPYTDDPEPFMGTVISGRAAGNLLEAHERLAAAGGQILVGMKRLRGIDALLSPGLMDVTGIKNRPDEEFFGPFLQVIRVPDFDSALKEANDTSYGLAAGLLSDSQNLYQAFLRRIRAGVVNWNRQLTGASSSMPFGGIGSSGNHRPSAYFAADYCSYPVSSIETNRLEMPRQTVTGIRL